MPNSAWVRAAAASLLCAGMAAWLHSASAPAPGAPAAATPTGPRTLDFDAGWRFFQGEAAGAQAAAFDDAQWSTVDVPHDWSIAGPFDQNNPTRRGGAHLPSGVSWYRKSFTLPAADAGQRVFVDFDGVMANAEVWLNGQSLGQRPYGYVSYRYDLSPYVKFGPGETNVLAVRTDTTRQPDSRWYTGQGIYRHVRLVLAPPTRIQHWGVFVTTPKVTPESATVRVQVTFVNDSGAPAFAPPFAGLVGLTGPAGENISLPREDALLEAVPPGQTLTVTREFEVPRPKLWDIDSPNLYQLRVAWGNTETVTFGIRSFEFKPETGFWLNGRNLKLYGVCLHHDGGAFGAAVPLGIWEQRLAGLKAIGANAIRTAHNPPAPEFLDLCDRLGFLVMDETFDTWRASKPNATYGYQHYFNDWWEADTRDTILRDRNHPSIILWSVGNEIRDSLNSENGRNTFLAQRDLINRLDGTRPVTMALFRPNDPSQRVYTNGFAELMGVVGQNYREAELVALHRDKPNLAVIGTENGQDRATWLVLRDNPFMSGQFLWTGVDYLGEADWPLIGRQRMPLDRTGAMSVRGYERQSWWSPQPMVFMARSDGNAGGGELAANWTPSDPGTYDEARVSVFSNCEEVELFLNGVSQGALTQPSDNAASRSWTFDYAPGTLRAVARNGGREVATHELKTAGAPAKIVLTADRDRLAPGFDHVAVLTATITDADGVPVPRLTNEITFTVSGPGVVAAVDNADPAFHGSFKGSAIAAHNGRAVAFVKAQGAPGALTVAASSPGLAAGTASVTAAPAP